MLPRPRRLTSPQDFAAVFQGRRWVAHHRFFSVFALPGGTVAQASTSPSVPRVGFIVSKKVGNAVLRNRVRRRLRHGVRLLLPQLPSAKVIVIRANPSCSQATWTQLKQALSTTFTTLETKRPHQDRDSSIPKASSDTA